MEQTKQQISTANIFGVCAKQGKIGILFPKPMMTQEEALQLAAWLVAMAYQRSDEFPDLLKRVENC